MPSSPAPFQMISTSILGMLLAFLSVCPHQVASFPLSPAPNPSSPAEYLVPCGFGPRWKVDGPSLNLCALEGIPMHLVEKTSTGSSFSGFQISFAGGLGPSDGDEVDAQGENQIFAVKSCQLYVELDEAEGVEWEGHKTISLSGRWNTESDKVELLSLICDPSESLVVERLNERELQWKTQYGCPSHQTRSTHSPNYFASSNEPEREANPDAAPEDEKPSDEEGDHDLVPPTDNKWSLSRHFIAATVLIFGMAAFAFTIIASRQSRQFVMDKLYSASWTLSPIFSRLTATLFPFAKSVLARLAPVQVFPSNPFRQEDSRLVRWAEEDMALEEDFMVNSGRYELEGEDWDTSMDEYIPLTISPKWGRKMPRMGYGAATNPGDVKERIFPRY